ncbi:MAG: hypothetical protein H6Q14_2401 [Bacteroidetes bacterium]|jgi:hypothetical protein|nr:hypothetical protein [Bacteroidota bacterium]
MKYPHHTIISLRLFFKHISIAYDDSNTCSSLQEEHVSGIRFETQPI